MKVEEQDEPRQRTQRVTYYYYYYSLELRTGVLCSRWVEDFEANIVEWVMGVFSVPVWC